MQDTHMMLVKNLVKIPVKNLVKILVKNLVKTLDKILDRNLVRNFGNCGIESRVMSEFWVICTSKVMTRLLTRS